VQQITGVQEVILSGLGRPESCIHSPEEHTTCEDIVSLAKTILAYLSRDFAPDRIPEHQP
jgi:succinyl-diaminopimelate desuccinylase